MQRLDVAVIRRRGGFTLIELLVVIAIIALIAGLLLVAIGKARSVGPRVQTKAEIGQLNVAVESFKSTYNVQYIPSCLWLTNDYTAPSPGIQESRQYVAKVWPKAFLPVPPAPAPGFTQWPPAMSQYYDGNQVLALMLGGLPPNRAGWTNSPTNPFQIPADGSVAKGPFYDFKADRFDQNGHYLDPYGQPYYYFSSRSGNDYDYFGKVYYFVAPDGSPNPDTIGRIPGMTREGGYGDVLLPQPGPNLVAPFKGLDGKYLNPSTFQIISMGENKQPGRGSPCLQWSPNPANWAAKTCQQYQLFETGIGDYAPGGPGGDDLSNFQKGPLGGD